jgi:hypothetical protein
MLKSTKTLLDKLVFLHVTLKNEVNSEKPDKDKIEASFDIQALTLLELKDELNGSYYMTDQQKEDYGSTAGESVHDGNFEEFKKEN